MNVSTLNMDFFLLIVCGGGANLKSKNPPAP